mmetsp:Transcript_178/g.176  ORF Transcript_178/g.176 Transcript_178/m.176 type:complete len:888 (+) Transcript_178:7-2670(+)
MNLVLQTSMTPIRVVKKNIRWTYWIGIFTIICMIYTIRNSIVVSQSEENIHSVNITKDYYDPNTPRAPRMRSRNQSQYRLDPPKMKRSQINEQNRKERTIPTTNISSTHSILSYRNTATDVMAYSINSIYPSFPTNDYIFGDDYCDRNVRESYNASDQILISRILSHPLAFELALVLALECGVTHILGLSDHIPNAEESFRYEFLMQRIPHLRVHISSNPLGRQAMEDLFEGFSPTYIFYFQSDSFLLSTDEILGALGAFTTHAMIDELQQICNTIVKTRSERPASFLHVTSNVPYTNTKSAGVFSKLSPILLDTYRFQYQLIARQLNLPDFYGPFEGGATWLHSDDFLHRTSMVTDTVNTYDSTSTSMSQPLISISKAIQSILVSGSLEHTQKQNSIPILAAAKSQTTTLLKLSKTLFPVFLSPKKNEEKTIDDTLLPILSWNYKQTSPYEDPSSTDDSTKENVKITKLALINTRHHVREKKMDPGVSLLERRQHHLFPCISACSSFVHCHQLSIWNSVLSITKDVTAGCKYLLYMTNFSSTVETLPFMREAENKAAWPKESFCQFAFVLSNSSIVNNTIIATIKQDGQPSVTEKSIEKWNGRISSNGWTLVWIDEDEQSLSEADYMMPKMIPESIVNDGVVKAFYLEPQHFKILPSLQIIWYLMGRQLDSRTKPKSNLPGGKQVNALIPSRHIALFAHTYNTTSLNSDPTQVGFMVDAAKFILKQKGDNMQGYEFFQNTTRQFEVYAKSITWQKAQEEESEFQLVDTSLMIYSVDSVRSKRLRCEWYEEHLFWSNENNNRNLEELSLSYVLYRWRRQRRLLPLPDKDTTWGEMVMLGESGEDILPPVEVQGIYDEEKTPLSESQHFVKLYNPLKARTVYLSPINV